MPGEIYLPGEFLLFFRVYEDISINFHSILCEKVIKCERIQLRHPLFYNLHAVVHIHSSGGYSHQMEN